MDERMSEGHFVRYQKKEFREESLQIIAMANKIIEEYEGKGMTITLRQLYYQFVARDYLPNTVKSYNKLGGLINDGRLAGLVSWTAIEDRGRNLMGLNFYASPAEAMRGTLSEYRIDMWHNQPFRPEVWVEKAALEGVIGSICNKLRVNFFSCRGYNSQSEQWRAGRRLAGYVHKGQKPIVFHLGDHDPSGLDMTRDNRDRLSMFAGVPVQLVRLALNLPQIEQYNPPPNPAKMTDSRFETYQEEFGDSSWELDALEPMVIQNLISDAILKIRDEKKWEEAVAEETSDKMDLESSIEEME